MCDVVPTEDQCKNGGICYADDDGNAGCLCPMPYTGITCVRGEQPLPRRIDVAVEN